jgi:group I intron endonuclease
MSEKFVIYKITNTINNKIYIGQTNDFNRRKSQYKHAAKQLEHDQLITKAMYKYGYENFIMEIIDEVNSREEANIKEEEYMVKLDSRNKDIGYNMATGGGVFGLTDEIKEKISEKLKEFYSKNVSKIKGKALSEEHKLAISKASFGKKGTNLGKKFSPEHIEKIRIANTNKKHTEETKLKMSLKRMGVPPSNKKLTFEQAQEIRNSNLKVKELAEMYNVSSATISSIRRNVIFVDINYIPKPCKSTNRKLTFEQAEEIRASNESSYKLAKKYGVDRSCIERILDGSTYKTLSNKSK